MSKFLNFEQFNESTLADLFKSIHGAIDFSTLKPLMSVAGTAKLPSEKAILKACKYLDIKPDTLFYDPNGMLDPIIYLNGPIFVGLMGFPDEKHLKIARIKERLAQLEERFKEFTEKKDYITMFYAIDKKLIIPMYIKMFDEIPKNQSYDIFADLWVRSEYGFEQFTTEFLKRVFELRFSSPEWKTRMKQFDKAAKKNPDGTITVYHGNNPEHDPKDEMSWTLQKKTAKFFANRFNANGKIYQKNIERDHVLDFFPSRGEAEVLLMN
jgi:hypothetical protein